MSDPVKKINDCRFNRLSISIIILLSLGIIFLSYLYYQQIKETDKKVAEVEETTRERESLKIELNMLIVQYDSLMTDNDSINYLLEEEQIKIKGLLSKVNSRNIKISSLKDERNTLRDIMKSYVVQIDSLNIRNKVLIAENIEVTKKFRQERKAKKELEEKARNLEEKVETASTLTAKGITIEVQKKRGRKTRMADKVVKIKVNFFIPENSIALSEEKNIYLRIARPDELILAESEFNLFEFEGKEIVYSAMRVVEYNNINDNNVEVWCDNYETLVPGIYNVDIFSEGKIIGTSIFELR